MTTTLAVIATKDVENIDLLRTMLLNCKSDIATSIQLHELLGCGEYGCTYSMKDHQDHVVKVVKFEGKHVKRSQQNWINEIEIQTKLGKLLLSPKVHGHTMCGEFGVVVMDRVQMVSNVRTALVKGCNIKQTDGYTICKVVDYTQKLINPVGFIHNLQEIIDAGFIHMDNHIGNMGYTLDTHTPCFIDYGFAIQRDNMKKNDKLWCLAFSIGIILERTPINHLKGPLYDTFYTIWNKSLASRYVHMDNTIPMWYEQLKNEKATTFDDMYIGMCCYAKLLRLSVPERDENQIEGEIILSIQRGYFKTEQKKDRPSRHK